MNRMEGVLMRVSRRRRVNRYKEEKKRKIRKGVLITVSTVAVIVALNVIYLMVMQGRFYHHTTINGYHVSGMTVDEVASMLTEPYNELQLNVEEDGVSVLTLDFAQMGYAVNEEQLRQDIEEVMTRQSKIVYGDLILGNDFGMRVPFVVDREVFHENVTSSRFTVPRVVTEDAQLVEKDGVFVIQPEVYGNDLDDTELEELVKKTIDEELTNASVETVITVPITADYYKKPQILQDDAGLNEKLTLYNRFCQAEITYTFGEQKEVLDWNTIKDWLVPEDTENPISEDAIYNYVYNMAVRYDTIYVNREFETTYGYTVTLPSNDYGYQIDQDAEFAQLKADIYANAAVEREPVYAIRGYSRNGYDDLNGTYVEVDLTGQYLWFYKDGEQIVESPVITGMPKDDRETAEGAFAIPYKASPFNLKGGGSDGTDSWDVEVRYWMPFHEGQGLHDADWQGSFGGDAYLTRGSHGCVNLPVDVAAIIYEYMEENVAIILYK